MLSGEFVYLRAVEAGDLEQLLSWRNRPEFRQYFREHQELSMANQKLWFENVVVPGTSVRMFAIIDAKSNELIGACGLCLLDLINRSADLSIYIGADGLYVDDRFAPDAARLLMDYGFNTLGLHRIWAEIYSCDNEKNVFFRELGFVLDGTLRQTYYLNGAWNDSNFYSLLAHEYRTKQGLGSRD